MKRIVFTIFFILFYIDTSFGHAETVGAAKGEWSAEVFSVEGTGELRSSGTTLWKALTAGEKLFKDDEVRVGAQSRMAIQFRDGYFIRLASNSHLTIEDNRLALSDGKLHFFNRTADASPQIVTPLVTAAIRGTELIVEAGKKLSRVSVLEGSVLAKNEFGEVSLLQNEAASAAPGQAPVKSLIVSSKELAQWTISIPALAERSDDKKLAEVLRLIGRGAMGEAEESLRTVSTESDIGTSERLLFALSGGRAEEAKSLFNNLENKSSTAAVVARSYYLQSKGELEEALNAISEARAKNSTDPMVLGRAAELNLYFGNIDEAQEIISNLCGISCANPSLAVIQGFIYLTTESADTALRQFDEVIKEAPSLSRAYMGRGLALVKKGDLEGAKVSFQRAIALDPSVSVYRSYLGKLNFERDDNSQAYREYGEAMRLDENDPTPYLYRAYTRLSDNDPLGAIADIETSIEKNNKRAVYRSRLLLDQDEASRSAALGRAFRETGFYDGARVEAIRSITEDPTNYSAYQLLAESYDYFFSADTALSELRKARLLAPVSINLLNSSAGLQNGLTSYDTLFDGNRFRTGLGYRFDGRDDIHVPSLTTVGKKDSTAWGFSVTSALGDGFKKGSFLRDTLVDGTVEEQISWDKKLLFQGTGRFIAIRDLNSEEQDIDTTDGSAALSYVQHVDADQVFIADVSAERVLDRAASPLTGRTVDFDITFNGEETTEATDLLLNQLLHEHTNLYRTGLQYIHSGPTSIIAGTQFLHQTPDRHEESIIEEDSQGILDGLGAKIETESRSDLTGYDLYLYSTSKLRDDFSVTLGLVRTDIETDHREIPPFVESTASKGRFNPKAGFTWEPHKNTFVRASYTESLRKSSLEDQLSLEPSFVSGIPQRFNDLTGTTARDAGIGINWKDPGKTYVGTEYVYRRISEPFWFSDEVLSLNFDTGEAGYTLGTLDEELSGRRQHFIRSYLSQRICRSFAFNLEHQHSEDNLADEGFHDDLTDDVVSATLRWFDRSGVFAYFGPYWIRQDRKERFGFDDGVETAWIWNATLGYRIPHRQGRIFVQARNMFDQKFDLDQSTGFNEFIKPDSAYLAGFEFNF